MGEVLDLTLARRLRRDRGSTKALERAAAARELVRIRPGAYVTAEAWAEALESDRHRALVAAARAAASREPVFSHESAAALHDIPVLGRWPRRAVVTVPRGRGVSNRLVERVQRVLSDADVMHLQGGVRTTTPLRTAIDLAARRSTLSGIVAISHVRWAGVCDEELAAALDRAGRMPGIRAARIAAARSTELSESPLEAIVVARCADLGFAPPEQQRRVRGIDGGIYRVDFAWRDGRILAEADGKLKYRSGARSPRPADVLWAEKRREDALRARCDAFFRIDWADAWEGAGLERAMVAAGVPRIAMPSGALTF